MIQVLKKVLPKKDGRGTITNVVASFTQTIKTLDEAVQKNEQAHTKHAEEIVKRNAEIRDLEKHNEIAQKLKNNLANLIQ